MNSKPLKVTNFFFGSTFLAIVNGMSVIGFFVLFATKKDEAIIALIAFVIFLLVLIGRIFWVTDQFLKNKSENGYEKLSTTAKYFTRDGSIIEYELKKFIQCKQILMDMHEHEYYWSGTKTPLISSETMKYEKVIDSTDGRKKAVFKLPAPLLYNGVFVAHIKMEIDDSDKQSKTFIEHAVKEKMQLIGFKVVLLYKRGNVPDAKLLRRPLGTTNTPYEHLKAVPFEKKTFSFEYDLFAPEIGYAYRLEWQR